MIKNNERDDAGTGGPVAPRTTPVRSNRTMNIVLAVLAVVILVSIFG